MSLWEFPRQLGESDYVRMLQVSQHLWVRVAPLIGPVPGRHFGHDELWEADVCKDEHDQTSQVEEVDGETPFCPISKAIVVALFKGRVIDRSEKP